MFPVDVINNGIDTPSAHSEVATKSGFADVAQRVASFDLPHLLWGKFCTVVHFSNGYPALFNRIANVLLLCSKPKVIWSNAERIIASVKNSFSVWNWSVVENPTSPVSFDESRFFGALSNPAVSVSFRYAPGPNPAPISLDDLLPKALWERVRKTLRCKVLSGNLDHSYSVLPSGFKAQTASSFSQTDV